MKQANAAATPTPTNCVDCKYHRIVKDPDPDDWFCDDDVAVVCSHPDTPRKSAKPESRYEADRQTLKTVTVGCRPYRTRSECATPQWCPLLNGGSVVTAPHGRRGREGEIG
jgi:hypothetical protein